MHLQENFTYDRSIADGWRIDGWINKRWWKLVTPIDINENGSKCHKEYKKSQ